MLVSTKYKFLGDKTLIVLFLLYLLAHMNSQEIFVKLKNEVGKIRLGHLKLFVKECLDLMGKVIMERFSDNKQEDDRYLGSIVSVYQMHRRGERTRGRDITRLLQESMSTDKSLNKESGKRKSEIFQERCP